MNFQSPINPAPKMRPLQNLPFCPQGMVLCLIVRPDQKINKTLSVLRDFAVQKPVKSSLPASGGLILSK